MGRPQISAIYGEFSEQFYQTIDYKKPVHETLQAIREKVKNSDGQIVTHSIERNGHDPLTIKASRPLFELFVDLKKDKDRKNLNHLKGVSKELKGNKIRARIESSIKHATVAMCLRFELRSLLTISDARHNSQCEYFRKAQQRSTTDVEEGTKVFVRSEIDGWVMHWIKEELKRSRNKTLERILKGSGEWEPQSGEEKAYSELINEAIETKSECEQKITGTDYSTSSIKLEKLEQNEPSHYSIPNSLNSLLQETVDKIDEDGINRDILSFRCLVILKWALQHRLNNGNMLIPDHRTRTVMENLADFHKGILKNQGLYNDEMRLDLANILVV